MTQEDRENFCNAVRSEVKGAGILDTPENCWDFFVEKVLSHLDTNVTIFVCLMKVIIKILACFWRPSDPINICMSRRFVETYI